MAYALGQEGHEAVRVPLKSKAEVYLAFLAFPLLRSTFQPDLAKSFKHVVKLVPELRHLLFETMLGSLNSFLCAFLSLVDSLFNSFIGFGDSGVGLFVRFSYPTLDLGDCFGSTSL